MGFFSNVKTNIDGGIGNFKMKWDDASRSYDDEDDMVDDIDEDDDEDEDDGEPVVKGKKIKLFEIPTAVIRSKKDIPNNAASHESLIGINKDQLVAVLPIAFCDVFGCAPAVGTAAASILMKLTAGGLANNFSNINFDAIVSTASSFGYDANLTLTVCSIFDKLDDDAVVEKMYSAIKARSVKPVTVGMNFNGVGQQPILVG